jgi:hypothetical protein
MPISNIFWKHNMKIYLVGNREVKSDSIPVRLKNDLTKSFPDIYIEEVDPNENFIPESGSVIIDTVAGIDKIQWFDSITDFSLSQSVSPHDYDLLFHLQMLDKLHKLPVIRILGIPLSGSLTKVRIEIIRILTNYMKS